MKQLRKRLISIIFIFILILNGIIPFMLKNITNKFEDRGDNKLKLSDQDLILFTPENITYESFLTPFSGYYPATYGFENDHDGGFPKEWIDDSVGALSFVIVESEKAEHKKVFSYNNLAGSYARTMTNLSSSQTNGSIEYYVYKESGAGGFEVSLRNSTGDYALRIGIDYLNDGQFWWRTSGSTASEFGAGKYSDNTWFHIRIDFDIPTKKFDIYLDGIKEVDQEDMFYDINSLQSVWFYQTGSGTSGHWYLDALGFSWDSKYNIGDNFKAGLLVNFTSPVELDWMGYSLDEQTNQTILGNSTIPMPENGLHNIKIYGNDSLGTLHESENRYFTIDQYPIKISNPENKTYYKPMQGCYPATFGFENDENGNDAAEWVDNSGGSSTAQIVGSIGNHTKVYEFYDGSSGAVSVSQFWNSPRDNGSVELYFRTSDNSGRNQFHLRSGLNDVAVVSIYEGKWKFYNGTWNDIIGIQDPNSDRWYHIKLEWEATTWGYAGLNQWEWHVYIDGIQYGSYDFSTNLVPDQILCYGSAAVGNYNFYIDGVGYSWDPYYQIGDNLNEGLLLNFNSEITLNWTGYSFDGQQIRTILGNSTILFPGDGLHNIQVYGNDSLGMDYESDIRYFSVDTTPPIITINSPTLDQITGNLAPDFSLTIIESNLNTTWYTLDEGITNTTFTGMTGTIDQSEWDKKGNGSVIIRFYANDTGGLMDINEISVIKDTSAPYINISSPEENEFFRGNAPDFNVEVFDLHLDKMWYSLDNGLTNFTFTTNNSINQAAWDNLYNGIIEIIFYANDTGGNEWFTHVNVIKEVIFIDDQDSNYNWEKTEAEYWWCTGSGTEIDPYIIKNLEFDGQGSNFCIEIRNSNVFVIIEDNILNNTEVGIKISDSQNIKISNTSIYDNTGSNGLNGGADESGGEGQDVYGIALHNCDNIYFDLNTIISITGGNGGSGGTGSIGNTGGNGGSGGNAYGIYVNASDNVILSNNVLSNINGGNGGKGGDGGIGFTPDIMVGGIGGQGGDGAVSGIGGSSSAILIENSLDITIEKNIISNIIAGNSSDGGDGSDGGTGRPPLFGSGTYRGGDGGNGGEGNSGGNVLGIFFMKSSFISINENEIQYLISGFGGNGGKAGNAGLSTVALFSNLVGAKGGAGGKGGIGGFSVGIGFGESFNIQNRLNYLNGSFAGFGGSGGLGGHGRPGGTGGNGGIGGDGVDGGFAFGIFYFNSSDIINNLNSVNDVNSGVGGDGNAGGDGEDGGSGPFLGSSGGHGADGGDGGTAGIAAGVVFESSLNITSEENTIDKIEGTNGGQGGNGGNGGDGNGSAGNGGNGGDGGDGGDGDNSHGLYLKNSEINVITWNEISVVSSGNGGGMGMGGAPGIGNVNGIPGLEGTIGLSGNHYGLFLENSNQSLINLNSVYCQYNFDNGLDNDWDDGSIGNFWSFYIGSDNNHDGIGDVPYEIDGSANSTDNYPIVNHLLIDLDGDGLSNGEEMVPGEDGYITSMTNPDTDNDSFNDGTEAEFKTSPLDPTWYPMPNLKIMYCFPFTVLPGESFVFDFVILNDGIWKAEGVIIIVECDDLGITLFDNTDNPISLEVDELKYIYVESDPISTGGNFTIDLYIDPFNQVNESYSSKDGTFNLDWESDNSLQTEMEVIPEVIPIITEDDNLIYIYTTITLGIVSAGFAVLAVGMFLSRRKLKRDFSR